MNEPELLKRRIAREIAARKAAEEILEKKSMELYEANEKLRKLNQSLEETVERRTSELAESQSQFRQLVESASDIIYNADAAGFFTYVNPVTNSILGFEANELLGIHYTDLIPEEHCEQVEQFYLNQMRDQQATSYFEFPVYKADGSIVWLGQRVEMKFENGYPYNIMAIARDISQLREARQALEASEEKYRSMIEGMNLGLLEVDNEGIVTHAYPLFCELVEYSAEELIGQNPIGLLAHPDDLKLIDEQARNREKGESGVYELRLRKKSGEWIWVIISGAPFYSPKGEILGSVGIHLDISYQKKLQAQLEVAKEAAENAQMAEKQFLAKMSHELRTPLNALTGIAYLLGTTPLNEVQQEYLQDIQYASDIMRGLISDVLDMSKIEAGEVSLTLTECHVRYAVQMLTKTLEYKAREGENEIIYQIDDDIPEAILIDKNLLNQILINLVGNALKFTKNGTISLDIGLAEMQGDELTLKFGVHDTGIGISEDKLSVIFEKYKQERKEIAEVYGGTGLGLHICRELVTLLGGKIWVESEQGEGSSFYFTIKAKSLSASQGAPLSSGFLSQMHPGEKVDFKILVAEDSFLNQKYLSGLLTRWNIDFDIASDGVEALKKSLDSRYDVILMDMQMPLKNGYETVVSIRENKNNPNQNTTIIALTASAMLEEKRHAEAAGVDGHISKPYTPEQLYQALINFVPNTPFGVEETAQEASPNPFLALELPEVVNRSELIRLYGDDLEHASHMMNLYLNRLESTIEEARLALKSNDIDILAKWLHKVKPSLNMVGLTELAGAFGEAESVLKNNSSTYFDTTAMEALLAKMQEYQPIVTTLLRQIQKNSPS